MSSRLEGAVIACHNHYVPPKLFDRFKVAGRRDLTGKIDFMFYEKLTRLDDHLADMEEAGVDMFVINLAQWNIRGLDVCRELNDGYAEVVRRYPDKFVALAHVPPTPVDAALAELHRAVKDLGMKGVGLMSSFEDITLTSPEMRPFYEAIAQLDVPIFIHPSLLPKGAETEFSISRTLSRAFDITKAGVRILFGVFQDFPTLRFVLPHHGGTLPLLRGRICAFFEPEGVAIPEDLRNMPKSHREVRDLGIEKQFDDLFDRLYFDTAGLGGWMPGTRATLQTVRADRLCLGFDYPMEIHVGRDLKQFVEDIRALDIPEGDKRQILGGNMVKLLRL